MRIVLCNSKLDTLKFIWLFCLNANRARAVWCLLSRNRLEHLVFIEKSKQYFNNLTFPFFGDTKLQFAQANPVAYIIFENKSVWNFVHRLSKSSSFCFSLLLRSSAWPKSAENLLPVSNYHNAFGENVPNASEIDHCVSKFFQVRRLPIFCGRFCGKWTDNLFWPWFVWREKWLRHPR